MATGSGTAVDTGLYEEYLDRATAEVFGTMMAIECVPDGEATEYGRERMSAVIGLAGAVSGSLVLHCGLMAALRISECLTGVRSEAADPVVRDAIGEVCNMVAGAWKGHDGVLCSGCMLSTPTVVAGSSYELFSQRAPTRIERSYRFEQHGFTVTIFFESCQ